ncbi:unnamed protein product [Camellia sinensis]
MQAAGIIPNSQTCGILLDGLCKNGHISEALSLFHMIESNSLHLNVVMYNILIDAFCKDKKLDTARALFNNLSSKGLQPDVKTYTTMIQGFCEEGLLHEAKELFVKMEHNGCLPDDVTYNTIIRGFIGQHKCYEALILVEEMVQRGFSADASNSSLIIDILSTKGQDPALQEVIKKFMPKDSHGMQEIETEGNPEFPTSFPCMWPSGTHLGKEVWNLGLDLVSAQHAFPRSFAYIRDLFESAFNRLCPVFVGLGLVSTPTCEELCLTVSEVVPKILFEGPKIDTIAHVPPPQPKCKAAHPYLQKAPKNVLAPSQAFMAYPSSLNSLAPGYSPWDDTSMLIHSPSGGIMLSQDEYNLHGVEGMPDIGSKGVSRISNSGIDGIGSLSRTISSSELSKQGKPVYTRFRLSL